MHFSNPRPSAGFRIAAPLFPLGVLPEKKSVSHVWANSLWIWEMQLRTLGGGAQVVDVIDEHDNRAFLRGFYDFGNHD